MGTLIGHLGPGLGFFLVGLWQLFNHIKLYCQDPKKYNPSTWFPYPKIKYLELYFIMALCFASIVTELFIVSSQHHPLDPEDWTIPITHLANFDHSTISFTFLIYAAFTLLFDKKGIKAATPLSTILGSLGFFMELLLFFLHSDDHPSVEFHAHCLLQLVICICLITTTMGIWFPDSFPLGFLRSLSVFFQGAWFIIMSIFLYIPKLIPKGCSREWDDGEDAVPCTGHLSLHRAKGLTNIEFAWGLVAVVAFSMWFYLYLAAKYPEPEVKEYGFLTHEEEELCESPKMAGHWLKPMDLER